MVGFEHEDDARRFWDAMQTRLEEFSLALHPDKTRLLDFGRIAAGRRKRYGLDRPETFTFLGFIFTCGRTRRGAFQLQRKTRADRMRAKLRQIKEELRRRMHEPISVQGETVVSLASPSAPVRSSRFRSHRFYEEDFLGFSQRQRHHSALRG
ncbi:hypothetical protein N234_37035 [Ralstonia pickettii DTP0602]|nr:hypothetical protein N234_37035 [Ralstonia pickettii DTP0602]